MANINDVVLEPPQNVVDDDSDIALAVLFHKSATRIIYGLFEDCSHDIGFQEPINGYIISHNSGIFSGERREFAFNESVCNWQNFKGKQRLVYQETDPQAPDFGEKYSFPLQFNTRTIPTKQITQKLLCELDGLYDQEAELDAEVDEVYDESTGFKRLRNLTNLYGDEGFLAQTAHIEATRNKVTQQVRALFEDVSSPSVWDTRDLDQDMTCIGHNPLNLGKRTLKHVRDIGNSFYSLLPARVWESAATQYIKTVPTDNKDEAIYAIRELKTKSDLIQEWIIGFPVFATTFVLLAGYLPALKWPWMGTYIANSVVMGLKPSNTEQYISNHDGIIGRVLNKMYFNNHHSAFLEKKIADLFAKNIKLK